LIADKEIGLRMALGPLRGQVLRLIGAEGMTVGAIGIGVGVDGAFALSQVLTSLVFVVPVRDPLTFLAVAASIAVMMLAACMVPARKESRVRSLLSAASNDTGQPRHHQLGQLHSWN
jgi:putative ABC transport system permease protein